MSVTENRFSTAGFYGKKNKRKLIGLENSINSVVKKHQKEKIPKPFPYRILGPSTAWQIFYRQQEAFQFTKTTARDLHVFAFESDSFEGNTGQRLYLTASYPVFWHYYKQLDEEKRLHYEVIPEGAVCKLYFDLEFDKTVNPESDGDSMVDVFIQYVCKALETVFNISCTRKHVLDLQASTDRKFSRHLIFQLKNAAFKDNIHAGNFVCSILSKLLEKVQTQDKLKVEVSDETQDKLEVEVSDETQDKLKVEVFDETQYKLKVEVSDETQDKLDVTINQSHIKTELFVEAEVDKNSPINESIKKEKLGINNDILNEIVDSFSKEDLKKLIVKSKNGDSVLFCDTGVYTKNRNFRLFLSSKLGKRNTLMVASQNEYSNSEGSQPAELEKTFYDSLVSNVEYSSRMKVLTYDDNLSLLVKGLPGRKRDKSSQEAESIDGYNRSPYPEVDEYIMNIITEDSGKGVIRHWTYFHQGELLVYEIAKYRYCHNIGRHHRSNNIMFIVDLHRGVWYQKCHDPECHTQNYKSPEWPLPRTLLPDSYFDDDLEMDDYELLFTIEEMEKQYMNTQGISTGASELDDGADDELVAAVTDLDNTMEKG